MVGVTQINVLIPKDAVPGPSVTLVLGFGQAPSAEATLAIQLPDR